MKKLRLYSKPIVLVMICVFLSITSFGSQVNLGAKTKTNANINATLTPAAGIPAIPAAAVIAAGVALYAGAVVASYELGTIIGHAMYDLFGGESYLVPVVPEKYDSSDFSKFDS